MNYSNLKVFHYRDKLDSLLDMVLAPIHVRIKPTNICNHNCWYCCYRQDNLQLGRDMKKTDFIPKEKMLEIVDDLSEMGVKAVTFSGGGEPFCYPYLLETVRELSQTPIKFAALTNGARLEGEVAEVFARYATWVRVSMDGWDDESYSRFRSVPDGEYTKIMRNMKNYKKLGGYLGVSLIITNHNAYYLYESVKRLRDIGVDSVKISPCIVSDDAEVNNFFHQPFYGKVKREIEKAKGLIGIEIVDSYHLLDEKFSKDYTWCPYMQILPVIGADLNIYPCQDKAYNFDAVIGSIKEQRFKDFWYKADFYKINPSIHCNHHCVANTKNKMILEYLNVGHREFV